MLAVIPARGGSKGIKKQEPPNTKQQTIIVLEY